MGIYKRMVVLHGSKSYNQQTCPECEASTVVAVNPGDTLASLSTKAVASFRCTAYGCTFYIELKET